MNKFQTLAKNLLKNPLWSSDIQYIPIISTKNGIKNTFSQGTSINCKGVISSVSKDLIDGINVLTTDISCIVSSLDIQTPSKNDLIKINDKKYKIVIIKQLGFLNNTTTVFEFIIRLA